jgi:hypothetical protein
MRIRNAVWTIRRNGEACNMPISQNRNPGTQGHRMLEVVHSARKCKSGMLSYGAGLGVIAYDRAVSPCGHDHNGVSQHGVAFEWRDHKK